MQDLRIDLNEESGEPHFENDTMVAVKSNNLKHNTLIGSYVIIPKTEVSSPFELTEKEWADSKDLMLKVKEYIDKKYKPDGYNIGWNVGKAGGQEFKHAHIQLTAKQNNLERLHLHITAIYRLSNFGILGPGHAHLPGRTGLGKTEGK